MNINEKILGFDLRKSPTDIDYDFWDDERRMKYLLKSSIFYPLSVDGSVWPQTENEHLHEKLFVTKCSKYDSLYLDTGLQQLKLAVSDIRIGDLEKNILIAVSILDSDFSLFLKNRGLLNRKFPMEVGEITRLGWIFLGYDVADSLFYSSLSNCSFSKEEREKLQLDFNIYLNQYGLFTDDSRASYYSGVSNNRVLEHAPFFVFGIFALGMASGDGS